MNLRFSRLYFMPFLKANYQLNKAETALPLVKQSLLIMIVGMLFLILLSAPTLFIDYVILFQQFEIVT